jgi:hypothetical protein
MNDLQKENLVNLIESGIKLTDDFFSNYSNLNLKELRQKQASNMKMFTRIQRSWIEANSKLMHPVIIERALDFNEVWDKIYDTWEEK